MAAGTHFSGSYWSAIDAMRRNWGWYMALGIGLILIGAIAVAHAALATFASVMVFGWLFIIGGVLEAVHAGWRRQWSGFFIEMVVGILYAVAGFMLVTNPAAGALLLTFLIAWFLMLGGIFRIVASMTTRYHNWGWLLLNGVIGVLLGLMIWRQWPFSGLWVIGLFVGIDMIFNGWSLVMLGWLAREEGQPAY
jgi:uncharacterized membrane protein HdeD (DUF308 family)